MALVWSHKGLLGCVTDAGAQTRGWVKNPSPICWKDAIATISRLVQPFGESQCQYLYRAGLGHSAVNEAARPQQNLPCVYEQQAHPYCHCPWREALIFQPSHTWVWFVVCVTSVSTAVSAVGLRICSANHSSHSAVGSHTAHGKACKAVCWGREARSEMLL